MLIRATSSGTTPTSDYREYYYYKLKLARYF